MRLGASLADAGRARFIMQEGFGPGLLGGLAQGVSAFEQGRREGQNAYVQQALQRQQLGDMAEWRGRIDQMPEGDRALYRAMGPQTGAQALLQNQQREQAMAALRQAMPGLLGGAPSAAPQAEAPAMPSGSPQAAAAPDTLMPHFQAASRETGIPVPVLLAVARHESNFGTLQDRPGDGVGVMQVLRSTAQNPGFGMQGIDPATLRDPAQNIAFGARYLAARAGQGDWNDPNFVNRALASYNGGGDPNYVAKVRRYLGGGEATPVAGPAPAQGAPPAAAPQAGGLVTPQQVAQLGLLATQYPQLAPFVSAVAPLARQENQITTAAPGSAILRNGQMVGQIPERPGETERLYTRYRSLLEMPNRSPADTAEMEALRGRLGAERTVDRGPSAFDNERGKEFATVASQIERAGRAAPNQIMRLNQMERELERVTTGIGSGAAITAGQIAQRLGVSDNVLSSLGIGKDQVASAENIRSMTFQMVQATLSSGEFPSQNFSNADMQAVQSANPSLFNSPAGNRAIIAVQRAMAERNAEISRAWREWQRENGSNMDSTQRFLNERLPEIADRDVLTPILKDFRGQPAQPQNPPEAAPIGPRVAPAASSMAVPLGNSGMAASPPPPAANGDWGIRRVR